MKNDMSVYDVVRKLVGPIDPVGETHTDKKRLENLKVMTELVDKLLFDIGTVAGGRLRQEYSISVAGEHAYLFLMDVRQSDI